MTLHASARTAEIPFAGIRRVFEKAARLEATGAKVIHFEIGRPDFDTPTHVKDAAIAALKQGMVHYTPNLGIMELRGALSDSLEQYKNVSYDPSSEIMITAGGQEAMYLSLQALLEPGDEILVPNPGYSQFYSCVKLANGVPVPYSLRPEEGYAPDLDEVEASLSDHTRALILNSPHNPTGAVLGSETLLKICDFAEEHGILVLSDEAYDRILFEGSHFLSPAAVPGRKGKTIVWGSLSKTYAMTGWRIGYLAAPAEIIGASVKMQQNIMLSVCSFAQAGAVAALKGPQSCVAEMVAEFDRRRRLVLEGIGRCSGLRCEATPTGAFYVFVKHGFPGWTSAQLADHLLEKAHVALVPGSSFGPAGEGYLRLSYATSYDDCREGMDRIAECLDALRV